MRVKVFPIWMRKEQETSIGASRFGKGGGYGAAGLGLLGGVMGEGEDAGGEQDGEEDEDGADDGSVEAAVDALAGTEVALDCLVAEGICVVLDCFQAGPRWGTGWVLIEDGAGGCKKAVSGA